MEESSIISWLKTDVLSCTLVNNSKDSSTQVIKEIASIEIRNSTLHYCLSLVLALAIEIGAISVPALASASAESISEYSLKAAFVRNFLRFTTFPGAHDDLKVCVLGADAIEREFYSLDGKSVGGRPIRLETVSEKTSLCDLIFLGRSEKIRAIPERLRKAGVLTVGESENFNEEGGIVEFFTEEKRLRFRINREALEKSKLQMSSRLLSLAVEFKEE